MTTYARISDGRVIDRHEVADDVATTEQAGAEFLADLWGIPAADLIQADDTRGYPDIGHRWDGTVFAAPDPGPDALAAAYERGKADGAAELLAMQATVTESS